MISATVMRRPGQRTRSFRSARGAVKPPSRIGAFLRHATAAGNARTGFGNVGMDDVKALNSACRFDGREPPGVLQKVTRPDTDADCSGVRTVGRASGYRDRQLREHARETGPVL